MHLIKQLAVAGLVTAIAVASSYENTAHLLLYLRLLTTGLL
jgi:hypothetical protein